MNTCIGLDGCPAGWVMASARGVRVIADLAETLGEAGDDGIIAIDMPIGLPARVGEGGRAPERLVRPLLGARQSSVFSVPARDAVYIADYGEACAIALETSDPPRKVSKQTFNIFPKIRALDAFLRDHPDIQPRIVECHPEVSFWAMNGSRALDTPKKIKGRVNPDGMAARRALLVQAGIDPALVNAPVPRGAGADDVLDALAALWTARRVASGNALSFPDAPARDAHGLVMAIRA